MENPLNRPYVPPEERDLLAKIRKSESTAATQWKITDAGVPFLELLKWYVKTIIPALIFIALATSVVYWVTLLWTVYTVDGITEAAKRDPDFRVPTSPVLKHDPNKAFRLPAK